MKEPKEKVTERIAPALVRMGGGPMKMKQVRGGVREQAVVGGENTAKSKQ